MGEGVNVNFYFERANFLVTFRLRMDSLLRGSDGKKLNLTSLLAEI